MPELTKPLSRYRKHRASARAVATICGRDFYLGTYGTTVSRIENDRVICANDSRRAANP